MSAVLFGAFGKRRLRFACPFETGDFELIGSVLPGAWCSIARIISSSLTAYQIPADTNQMVEGKT
jgi:hypothetical protein